MDSEDAEDTKYQLIENQKRLDPSSQTDNNKKKKKKRVAPVEATIQVLQELPERASPLVGYFPSGFDPNSVEPSSTTVRVFRNRDKPKRLQLVATPPGSKVDFVGTNYTGEAEAGQQHCNYALGVLDKATQTLKVVPIASNKVILEPFFFFFLSFSSGKSWMLCYLLTWVYSKSLTCLFVCICYVRILSDL